jgi:hypothetical protein
MDPNDTDRLFVADADIDNELRGRTQIGRSGSRKRLNKSGQSSPALDSMHESAPLLSDEERSRPSTRGSDGSGDNVQWFGLADLEGLPWWKKPSVRACSFPRVPDCTNP